MTALVVAAASAAIGDPHQASAPRATTAPPVSIGTSAPSLEDPVDLSTTHDQRNQAVDVPAPSGPVPQVAHAAYASAAATIRRSDRACGLTWTLLAGIGWVESRHGSTDGSRLTARGVEVPPLYGARVSRTDTDLGHIDGSASMDRVIGPMQVTPKTWTELALDADGDGTRDPQDIADAALAVGLVLCSGQGVLENDASRTTALARLNQDASYAPAVLGAADHYRRHPEVTRVLNAPLPEIKVEFDGPTSTPSSSSPTPRPSSSATRTAAPSPTPGTPTSTREATSATPSASASTMPSVRPSTSPSAGTPASATTPASAPTG